MLLIRVAALPFLAVSHGASSTLRGAAPIDFAEEAVQDALYDELLGLDEIEEGDETDFAEEQKENYGSFSYLLTEEEQANGIDLEQGNFYADLFGAAFDVSEKND